MINSAPPDIQPNAKTGLGVCASCNGEDRGTRSLSQSIHQVLAVNFKLNAGNLVLTTPDVLVAFNKGDGNDSNGETGYSSGAFTSYQTNAFRDGFLSIEDPFDVEALGFNCEGFFCPTGGVSAGGVITDFDGTVPTWLAPYEASLFRAALQAFGLTATWNTGEKCDFQLGSLAMFPGGFGLPFSGQENGASMVPNVLYFKHKIRTPPLVQNGSAQFVVKLTKQNERTVNRITTVAPAPDADVTMLLRCHLWGTKVPGARLPGQRGE